MSYNPPQGGPPYGQGGYGGQQPGYGQQPQQPGYGGYPPQQPAYGGGYPGAQYGGVKSGGLNFGTMEWAAVGAAGLSALLVLLSLFLSWYSISSSSEFGSFEESANLFDFINDGEGSIQAYSIFYLLLAPAAIGLFVAALFVKGVRLWLQIGAGAATLLGLLFVLLLYGKLSDSTGEAESYGISLEAGTGIGFWFGLLGLLAVGAAVGLLFAAGRGNASGGALFGGGQPYGGQYPGQQYPPQQPYGGQQW